MLSLMACNLWNATMGDRLVSYLWLLVMLLLILFVGRPDY